jgi:hypothetical protein
MGRKYMTGLWVRMVLLLALMGAVVKFSDWIHSATHDYIAEQVHTLEITGRLTPSTSSGRLEPPPRLGMLPQRLLLTWLTAAGLWFLTLTMSIWLPQRTALAEISLWAAITGFVLARIGITQIIESRFLKGWSEWVPLWPVLRDLSAGLAAPLSAILLAAFRSWIPDSQASSPSRGTPGEGRGEGLRPPVPAPPSPPDWKLISRDVFCPLCSYNLRGLENPRCPECGHVFSWPQVFSLRAPWVQALFEYAPQRVPAAFFRTLKRTWLPGRFFSRLSQDDPIRYRRLVLYALLVVYLACLPLLGEHLSKYLFIRASILDFLVTFGRSAAWTHAQNTWAVHFFINWTDSISQLSLVFPAFCIGWSTLTYSLLRLLLGITRTTVNHRQLFRCVIYSADVMAWLSGPALIVVALREDVHNGLVETAMALCCYTFVVVFAWRLARAMRLYLHLPRTTLAVAQLLLALALASLALRESLWLI